MLPGEVGGMLPTRSGDDLEEAMWRRAGGGAESSTSHYDGQIDGQIRGQAEGSSGETLGGAVWPRAGRSPSHNGQMEGQMRGGAEGSSPGSRGAIGEGEAHDLAVRITHQFTLQLLNNSPYNCSTIHLHPNFLK